MRVIMSMDNEDRPCQNCTAGPSSLLFRLGLKFKLIYRGVDKSCSAVDATCEEPGVLLSLARCTRVDAYIVPDMANERSELVGTAGFGSETPGALRHRTGHPYCSARFCQAVLAR